MIRCQRCDKVTEPCESPERIVVKTRPKVYYSKNKYGESYETGRGYETVKEILICRDCYEAHKKTFMAAEVTKNA
jgi:hypothetical protein